MGVSAAFGLIHVAMLVLFSLCGITPMMWFNAFSVLFYVSTLALIRRKALRTYVVLVYLEVVAHMVFAIAMVGWDAGFQVTLIGMCTLAFFAEYLARSLSSPPVSGFALSLVGMCAYVFVFEFVQTHAAPYALPSAVCFWLQVAWGIIVFGIIIIFLQLFVTVTFESEKLLSAQLAHDKLTGLPNRYYMADYVRRLEESCGLGGCWVAMVDVDDFKKVNDVYGHNCGDHVLREVATILAKESDGAEICRWGGEEFLLMGKVVDGADSHVDKLDRVRTSIQDHEFWYEGQCLKVTATIGVASYARGMSVNQWINVADGRLYDGKRSGKNRVVA